MNRHNSEDDIRTKVVTTWLRGHGIALSDLRIEYSFTVQLGRTVFLIGNRLKTTPRADVLVQRSDGHNLLLVEVKAPAEPLDNLARDQGISYARGLTTGNMPPFVVLTNGAETRIIDTLTKADIQGTVIPPTHPHVLAGYVIGGDDLALRAEALELLVSLSADNLLQFCKDQCAHHMARLRSDDLWSGKKYLPAVCIDRDEPSRRLNELLDSDSGVILVIGQPQVGKTNFMCRQVESRLADGRPCLFYPAIGLRGGLLSELADDFGHVLGDSQVSRTEVITKLRRVASRCGNRLLLFVDGWNETTAEIARSIDNDARRLSACPIRLIVSLTNTAAMRLLTDDAGNPSWLAEAANVPPVAVPLIAARPISDLRSRPWEVVQIDTYSERERDRAYCLYAEHYRVAVPDDHERTSEPYRLGLAMEQYSNSILPASLDEPSLIGTCIERKSARAAGISRASVHTMLVQLADTMATEGAPLPVSRALKAWNSSSVDGVPAGLYDAALLVECVDSNTTRCVDFYFGRERDYCIACLALQWPFALGSASTFAEAVRPALSTSAGLGALRWFLQQPRFVHSLEQRCGSLPRFADPTIQKLFLSGLCDIALAPHESTAWKLFGNNRGDVAYRRDEPEGTWLNYAVSVIQEADDSDVRIEAVRLAYAAAGEDEQLLSALSRVKSLKESVIAMLTIGEDHPLARGSLGEVILGTLRSLHLDDSNDMQSGLGESEISSLLSELLEVQDRRLRRHAAECFGHIAPLLFCREVSRVHRMHDRMTGEAFIEDCLTGLANADATLGEVYYGSMCPGMMEWLRTEATALQSEHDEVCPVLTPIIAVFPHSATKFLRGLIADLTPPVTSHGTEDIVRHVPSPLNLRLPFVDSED